MGGRRAAALVKLTCGDKAVWEGEVRSCMVVVEERDTSKRRVCIVLETLGAVIEADVVESAQLMPWILTPRCPCMHEVFSLPLVF